MRRDVTRSAIPGGVVTLEVVGPRFGADGPDRSREEAAPLSPGQANEGDVDSQAPSRSVVLEVFDDAGALVIADERGRVTIAAEPDVDRSVRRSRSIHDRVERSR